MFCFLNTKSQVAIEDVADLAMNLNAEPCKNHNYSGRLGNLRTFVKQDGQYFIKGSLWKFKKGHNSGSYDENDFHNTVKDLDALTFGTYSQSKVIGYEFGINIITNFNPTHYLNSISASKFNNRSITLNPEFKNKSIWCRRTGEINRGFKVYSKTLESRISANILRIEYFVKNAKTALGRSIYLEEMKKDEFLENQFEIIRSFVNNLVFHVDYNPGLLESLKPQNKYKYLAYVGSGIKNPRAFVKSIGFDAVARSREYKNLMRIVSNPNDNDILKRELCEKMKNIIDSRIF